MKLLFNKCAAFSVRWRWLVILFIPIVIVLFSSKASNVYFANSPDMWFLSDSKIVKDYWELKKKFGDVQSLLIGIEAKEGSVLDPQAVDAVARIHKYLEENDQVVSIISLANYKYIRTVNDSMEVSTLIDDPSNAIQLLENPDERSRIRTILEGERIALGDLVTEDFKHTLIVAETKGEKEGRTANHVKLINDLNDFLSAENFDINGVNVHVFGRPFISHSFASGNGKDQGISYPLILLTSSLLIGLLFRRVRAILFPWAVIAGGLAVVYSTMGALGWATNAATSSLPYLVITVTFGMTVHIMVDYFRHLGKSNDSKRAAVDAIGELSTALFYTTLTTLIGFAGMAMTQMMPLREYAVLAIVGISTALLLSITLFPALLSFIKTAPSWARKENGGHSKILAIFSQFGRKHSLPMIIMAIAMTFVFVIGTFSMKRDSNFINMFKEDSIFVKEFRYFDSVFNGGQSIDLIVDSGREGGIYSPEFLKRVENLEEKISTIEGLSKPSSILEFMKEFNMRLNEDKPEFWRIADSEDLVAQQVFLYENSSPDSQLSNFYSPDLRYLKVTSRATNMSEKETHRVIEQIENEVKTNFSDLNIIVTGDLVLFNTVGSFITSGMITSFAFAFIFIFLSFVILFKSFTRSLITIMPSVFPLFVAGSVMAYLGIAPDLNTLIIASITLGIAVDDTMHYKIRFEHAIASGLNVDQAIDKACQEAGPGMVTSSLILIVGFSVFLFGSMQSSIYFGALSIIIIVTALLADLIFMPALLKRWGVLGLRKSTQIPAGDALAAQKP